MANVLTLSFILGILTIPLLVLIVKTFIIILKSHNLTADLGEGTAVMFIGVFAGLGYLTLQDNVFRNVKVNFLRFLTCVLSGYFVFISIAASLENARETCRLGSVLEIEKIFENNCNITKEVQNETIEEKVVDSSNKGQNEVVGEKNIIDTKVVKNGLFAFFLIILNLVIAYIQDWWQKGKHPQPKQFQESLLPPTQQIEELKAMILDLKEQMLTKSDFTNLTNFLSELITHKFPPITPPIPKTNKTPITSPQKHEKAK